MRYWQCPGTRMYMREGMRVSTVWRMEDVDRMRGGGAVWCGFTFDGTINTVDTSGTLRIIGLGCITGFLRGIYLEVKRRSRLC